MNNSFFNKFMPKETKFNVLLRQMAEISGEAAVIMLDCVKNIDHEQVVEYAKKIKVHEKNSDNVLVQIFDELNTTFITPFDREDIIDLANRMDDVTDHINSCAKKIMIYRPKNIPESGSEMVKLVGKASNLVLQAVSELSNIRKNAKSIRQYCEELHEVENIADEVFEKFLGYLFANEKDSIEVIKLKEIMQELEKATDATYNVGKIIKTIIVKYA